MSSERQQRAREIFNACRRTDTPHERSELVSRECGSDAELESAVIHLLEAHDTNGSFLEKPLDSLLADRAAGEPADPIDLPRMQEKPGMVIGAYKLLEQIGEGGFGVVYMAEQQQPIRRQVALKIIKPGMDTKEVIARFEVERQALALMEHPNIVTVHDAGATETGRPYFVMELVRGTPITDYCDEHQLTTREGR